MMIYDYIIVGSGISGLYSGYKILKENPSSSILILEAKKKKWVGGRMSNAEFYGVTVVTGAGIGRKDKDDKLIRLLKTFHIPFKEYLTKSQFAKTLPPCEQIDIIKCIRFLKSIYRSNTQKYKCMTFKKFAEPLLGSGYKKFLNSLPYTDFEEEDAYETLYNYGMDDNIAGWTALSIPWQQLVNKMASSLPIRFGHSVTRISPVEDCGFIVYTNKDSAYACKKVIIATTVSTVRKLLPTYKIYRQIHGQTFLRLYGKFSGCSIDIMRSFVSIPTIVPGPLKRIIPIDVDKGVYMISYSDNDNARYFKDRLDNNVKNRDWYCRLIEKSLGIEEKILHLTAIKDFYWPIATHYFDPLCGAYKNRRVFLKEAQHPMPGMLVVGEMVSLNQGWVRGALESVDAVL